MNEIEKIKEYIKNNTNLMKFKVTDTEVETRIKIDDLVWLFENSENNVVDDGKSSYATVKEDKKQEFAYKVVEMLLSEADQHSGCPYWGVTLDEIFLDMLENAEDDVLVYMEDLNDE
jgi:hypothetical protein